MRISLQLEAYDHDILGYIFKTIIARNTSKMEGPLSMSVVPNITDGAEYQLRFDYKLNAPALEVSH
jgi:hypothetical protein